jgi:outer membrane receptor for ferrienterochelin and colicin
MKTQQKNSVKCLFVVSVILVVLSSAAVFAEDNSEPNYLQMSLEDLMSVQVVSASRQEQKMNQLSVPVSVVTAEDIHYSGVTTIPEILRFYPGMDVLRPDRNRYSVGVRGLHDIHSERMQTLIDGRIADSPLFGGAEWNRYPIFMEDIKQIEIVRGPAGAAWGANALNGTINIITKDVDETQGFLASTMWNHFGDNYNMVRWGHKVDDKLSFRISSGYDDQESSKDAIGSSIDNSTAPSRDFGRNSKVNFAGKYKISETSKLLFGTGYSNVETGDYEFVMRMPRGLDAHHETLRSYAKLEHDFADGSSGNLQWYNNYQRTADPALMDEWHAMENVLEGQYNFSPVKDHNMAIGGIYRMNQINSRSSDIEDFRLEGEPFNLQTIGGFITDRWSVTDRFEIESQFRAEWYEVTGWDWAGRIAGLYALDDQKNHVFRVAAARAFRPPQVGLDNVRISRYEIAPGVYAININNVIDKDLDNEKTTSFEAGFINRLSDTLTVKTNTYYQEYQELIGVSDVAPGNPIAGIYQDNVGDAKAWGGDVEIEKATKYGRLSVWYGHNEFQEELNNQVLRAYLPAKNKLGATARVFLPEGWTLNANYRYSSFTPNDPGSDGAGLPHDAANTQNILDLALAKQIAKGNGELMVGVFDLFNRVQDYELDRGQYVGNIKTPGRTFFVRFQLKF